MASKKKEPRHPFHTFKSDLKVRWTSADNPLISLDFDADLVAVKETSTSVSYERVCPTCHKEKPAADATKLSSKYHCPVNAKHGPFAASDALSAAKVGKVLRVVATTEEVAEQREIPEDDPQKNILILSSYDALEVETNTYPIGTAHVIAVYPGEASYGLLLASVGHDGRIDAGGGMPTTLIGEAVLGKTRKLVQVRRWGDQLVLQELARPDDLKQGFEYRGSDLSDNAVAGLAGYFTSERKPFAPDAFLNEQKARMQAFTDAKLEDPTAVVNLPAASPSTAPNDDDALMAALEQSVSAAQAKKAPAKKAAARKQAS